VALSGDCLAQRHHVTSQRERAYRTARYAPIVTRPITTTLSVRTRSTALLPHASMLSYGHMSEPGPSTSTIVSAGIVVILTCPKHMVSMVRSDQSDECFCPESGCQNVVRLQILSVPG